MDLVMLHVMEAVDAERVEGVEGGVLARLESRVPLQGIFSAYVNSVLKAADRVGMERSFFLKLAGRVMVFPTGLMSPALAEGRKRVRDFYLQALAGVVPQMGAEDLGAAWDFFEAGLGLSLVNLRDDLEMEVQLERWVRFGVRGLGAAGVVGKATIDLADPTNPTDLTDLSEQPVVAEVVEIAKPAKAAKPKAKKSDDQSMTFDF